MTSYYSGTYGLVVVAGGGRDNFFSGMATGSCLCSYK